jgi:hypothetical protein
MKTGSKSLLNSQRKRGEGKPFEKNDTRINRNGAPKKFGEIRDLFKMLLSEDVKSKGVSMSAIETIARDWITSGDYAKQSRALEIAYGKIPDAEFIFDVGEFITSHLYYFTDAQIQRMQREHAVAEVFNEFLRECVEAKKLMEEKI